MDEDNEETQRITECKDCGSNIPAEQQNDAGDWPYCRDCSWKFLNSLGWYAGSGGRRR